MKKRVLFKILRVLESSHWDTFKYSGCFDMAAKKSKIFLIKVLYNIDSIQKKTARNLKIISKSISASPVIVGARTREGKLENGIVYERFGIPAISSKTLSDIIERGKYPEIYRDRGGFYVEIDRDKLKEVRKKKSVTQKGLAEILGVTKKMIYEHESKDLRMFLNIANDIENFLGERIKREINIFSFDFDEYGYPKNDMEREIKDKMKKIGFDSSFVSQAPFDCIFSENITILSDIEVKSRIRIKRVAELKRFTEFIEKPAILIADKCEKDEINGMPVLNRKKIDRESFISAVRF